MSAEDVARIGCVGRAHGCEHVGLSVQAPLGQRAQFSVTSPALPRGAQHPWTRVGLAAGAHRPEAGFAARCDGGEVDRLVDLGPVGAGYALRLHRPLNAALFAAPAATHERASARGALATHDHAQLPTLVMVRVATCRLARRWRCRRAGVAARRRLSPRAQGLSLSGKAALRHARAARERQRNG